MRAAERSVRRETRHVERARPGNSRQRLAVESQSSFRELLAAGAKYSQLDVRGNSSALEQRLHPVAEAMQARRAVGSRPGARTDGIKIALAVESNNYWNPIAILWNINTVFVPFIKMSYALEFGLASPAAARTRFVDGCDAVGMLVTALYV